MLTFTLSWLSYFTDLQGSQTRIIIRSRNFKLSYFTDLQGSQTLESFIRAERSLSYFTDLQGSQTLVLNLNGVRQLSYFTDLQGSQTCNVIERARWCLVTLLIYKVLKPQILVITEPSILAYV